MSGAVDAALRPRVRVTEELTYKRHLTPEDAEREAQWFRQLPWAAPELLWVDGSVLCMRTYPCCWQLRGWRPARELYGLILDLHTEGVHHRDVHPGNVVCGRRGPLLIDWETAIHQETVLSYDLVGRASGVPDPPRHEEASYSQWWCSSSPCSVKAAWGVDWRDLGAVV